MARLKKRADGYLRRTFTERGKRYYIYGRTAKELNEKEAAKREELRNRIRRREDPTVAEYYDRWSERRIGVIRESTHRGQQKMFNAMSAVKIPDADLTFGEIPLSQVSIDDLRVLQTELFKTRRTQTVNDYLAHMKNCFNDARREGQILINPFDQLKNLQRTEPKARDTHHRALTLEEQTEFFQSGRAKASAYYNVFRFAILTGMRCGEIGALKHNDIYDGLIHIERTITRTQDGGYRIGDNAKTKSGRRVIPVNDAIKEVLEEQNRISIILYGASGSGDDTIFKAPEGGLLMATPADRELKVICQKIGMEVFTMHAFRATFATRAVEAGIAPKTLQELMGHSKIAITMDLYAHVMTETKTEAMNTINIDIK